MNKLERARVLNSLYSTQVFGKANEGEVLKTIVVDQVFGTSRPLEKEQSFTASSSAHSLKNHPLKIPFS